MPYVWNETDHPCPAQQLRVWPYNALSASGFAAMILGFYFFAAMPLVAVLGSKVFWGLLPFVLAATGALWFGLRKNQADRKIVETLTITADQTDLHRQIPGKPAQDWQANTYWVTPVLHRTGGPVPNYVTLKGGGREVEIGAFLSEDERKALYGELQERLAQAGRLARG